MLGTANDAESDVRNVTSVGMAGTASRRDRETGFSSSNLVGYK